MQFSVKNPSTAKKEEEEEEAEQQGLIKRSFLFEALLLNTMVSMNTKDLKEITVKMTADKSMPCVGSVYRRISKDVRERSQKSYFEGSGV